MGSGGGGWAGVYIEGITGGIGNPPAALTAGIPCAEIGRWRPLAVGGGGGSLGVSVLPRGSGATAGCGTPLPVNGGGTGACGATPPGTVPMTSPVEVPTGRGSGGGTGAEDDVSLKPWQSSSKFESKSLPETSRSCTPNQ